MMVEKKDFIVEKKEFVDIVTESFIISAVIFVANILKGLKERGEW